MYRTIVVPLDGTALAARAVPYAEALAARHGSQLVLVRGVETRPFAGLDAARAALRQGQTYLEAVSAGLRTRPGAPAVETALFAGPIGPGIVREVSARSADLVVMASHARGGATRWLLGSVADHVLRHVRVPVLLVPAACRTEPAAGAPGTQEAQEKAPQTPEGLRLLIPLDGSAFAEQAIVAAQAACAGAPVDVVLLRAIEPPPPNAAAAGLIYDPVLAEEDAQAYLSAVASVLRPWARSVTTQVMYGPAGTVIAEVAQAERAQVIVMATHGHGGLLRLVLGSTAAAALHQARTPLLLVRPLTAPAVSVFPDVATTGRP